MKICGLTRPEDARRAAALGATDLGCVLVPGTPRCVTPARAREVLAEVPVHVRRVLVFRRARVEDVLRAAQRAGVGDVQLYHTEEAVAAELEQRGLHVRRVVEAPGELTAVPGSTTRVIDVGGGGTGRRFDWTSLAGVDLTDVFVAGGITAANVDELLPYRPGGLDVSSGVERAPGRKDPERLERLFRNIRRRRLGRRTT